jgi:ATP-dependent DNA helicase DinG
MEGSNSPNIPSLDIPEVLELLGPQSRFRYTIKGFEARQQQADMMRDVLNAYNSDAIALIEAGTGTGKSMAYLIPALLWARRCHERTLIATNTIALQEQLLHKDIPQLTKAMGMEVKVALVKGMGNYLCLRKLADLKFDLAGLPADEVEELQHIEAWASRSAEGSKASMATVPSMATWERVSAESDSCNNVQCPHYQECFFFKARRHAEDAQILIANHHLLFADLAVRADSENYASTAILPFYRRVIIDEAHHLEDVATDFFGVQVSKLAIWRCLFRLGSDKPGKAAGKLLSLRNKLLNSAAATPNREWQLIFTRLNIDLPAAFRDLQQRLNEAFQLLGDFVDNLSDGLTRPLGAKLRLLPAHYQSAPWQENVIPAVRALAATLQGYVEMLSNLEGDLKMLPEGPLHEHTKNVRMEIAALGRRLNEHAQALALLVIAPLTSDKVRWIESRSSRGMSNLILVDAELDVSKAMAHSFFDKFPTIVLCSATITANRQFEYIRRRLGIDLQAQQGRQIIAAIYDSPFNYHKQSLLAIPSDMPAPEDGNFANAAAEHIWQILQVTRGGTFVLFTSYDMMQQCSERLAQRFKEGRYNLYQQGEGQRRDLLHNFRGEPRAVLFGTDSFWEGVDVAGEALRCVILVKLPFKVPSEPIIEARMEAIQQRGGIPFIEYQLPQATVKFKQGVGRLIRHRLDRGCIVCLDKRLFTKSYGQQILNSLPPSEHCFAPLSQVIEKMRLFYRRTHHLVMQQ